MAILKEPNTLRRNLPKCLNETCETFVGHKTGYCESCRTKVCTVCNKTFVSTQSDIQVKQKPCTKCKNKNTG